MEDKRLQKLCGMIGLARRAGKTVIGTDIVCRAMPKGQIRLVLISATASAPTKKKLSVKSDFYGIKWLEAEIDTDRLGNILGKSGAVAAVAITDPNFAEEIGRLAVSE